MSVKRKEKDMLAIKSKHIVLPIVALLLVTGIAFAQQPGTGHEHNEKMCSRGDKPMIPGLTEEQKEQMRELRVEHMKEVRQLRNQIGEQRARLRTLSTSDKVNMGEINRVIEDFGKMRTQMMKARAQHRQDVRELLTDEQRVIFDAHQPTQHDGPHHAERHQGRKPR
jgi:Spy/CpxP family protein refolding chaperone